MKNYNPDLSSHYLGKKAYRATIKFDYWRSIEKLEKEKKQKIRKKKIKNIIDEKWV